MKVFKTVVKILIALAAIAGVIYVIATYGDKIVAWVKKVLASLPCKCCCEESVAEEVDVMAEPAAVENEETPVAAEDTVVADDADFEG